VQSSSSSSSSPPPLYPAEDVLADFGIIDDDDDGSDYEAAAKKKKSRGKPNKRRAQKADSDSEEYEETDRADDEALDFDNVEDEDEKLLEEKRSKTKGKKKGGKAASGDGGGKGRTMAELYEPTNAPPFFKLSLDEIEKKHSYLDPCGVEATDDIIDRLVGDQVDKIGALLQRALNSDVCDLGSAKSPLKLGTACSGTDAPALALTLVKEQMQQRNLQGAGGGQLFNYEHIFSCETEAFKSAYLARNFDSTPG